MGVIRKNAMKDEMERKVVYGSQEFIEKKKYDIEGTVKHKGRPKKDEE